MSISRISKKLNEFLNKKLNLHFGYISHVQKLLLWNYEAPELRGPGAGAPLASWLIRHWPLLMQTTRWSKETPESNP